MEPKRARKRQSSAEWFNSKREEVMEMAEDLEAFDEDLSLAERLESIRQLASWCRARFGKAPDVERLIQEMVQGKSIQKRKEQNDGAGRNDES
jgi:hypothetical protein